MNKPSKLMRMIVCAGAAAAMGTAFAQSEPTHGDIANPALGAGQQSVHNTPMGETGVSEAVDTAVMAAPGAVVVPAPTVIVVPAAPASSSMGAGPADAQPMVQPSMEPQRSEPTAPMSPMSPMQGPTAPRY